MDPQDVPHLFDCTAYPNDLSPVNLWDKPVEMIWKLSFLDPGSLDKQMRMVEEGIIQQQQWGMAWARVLYFVTVFK